MGMDKARARKKKEKTKRYPLDQIRNFVGGNNANSITRKQSQDKLKSTNNTCIDMVDADALIHRSNGNNGYSWVIKFFRSFMGVKSFKNIDFRHFCHFGFSTPQRWAKINKGYK